MKAICKKEGLLEALDLLSSVKGSKVHGLAARDGQVVVIAGTETTYMMAVVKATVTAKGYALLSKEAVSFLKTLSGVVTLSSSTRKVEVDVPRQWDVRTGRYIEARKEQRETGVLRIEAGGDSASFPFEDAKTVAAALATDAAAKKGTPVIIKDLGHAIGSVLYAAKAEERSWKSPMMGVGLVPNAKGFELVASDNQRLAVSAIRTSAKVSPAVIEPAAADILSHTDRVRMWQNKNVLAFQYGTVTLLTASQGEFPDYRQVIPAVTKRAAKVYTDDLREAVKKAATIVGSTGTIRLVSRGKKMKVIGMASGASAEPEIMSVGRIKQAYQASFLLDVLSRAGEVCEIRLPAATAEGWQPLPAVVRENGTIHLVCARIVAEWAPEKGRIKPETQQLPEKPGSLAVEDDEGDDEASDEMVGAGMED